MSNDEKAPPASNPSVSSEIIPVALSALAGVAGLTSRPQSLGAELTTFAIGGPIPGLLLVDTLPALQEVLEVSRTLGVPVRFLGNGSNLLIPDRGIHDEIVICLRGEFRETRQLSAQRLWIGAGASVISLSRQTAESALSGLEFAAGIPGSLGGAVVMNAGAHGGDFASILESVSILLPSGESAELKGSELQCSYRHTALPRGALVTGAVLKLSAGDKTKIASHRNKHLLYRKQTQPLTVPSAGSTFRNPSPELPAGKLLEELGMKGSKVGQAEISMLHANWVINPSGEASAEDVRGLIEKCRLEAREKRGIELRPEVVLW